MVGNAFAMVYYDVKVRKENHHAPPPPHNSPKMQTIQNFYKKKSSKLKANSFILWKMIKVVDFTFIKRLEILHQKC